MSILLGSRSHVLFPIVTLLFSWSQKRSKLVHPCKRILQHCLETLLQSRFRSFRNDGIYRCRQELSFLRPNGNAPHSVLFVWGFSILHLAGVMKGSVKLIKGGVFWGSRSCSKRTLMAISCWAYPLLPRLCVVLELWCPSDRNLIILRRVA